MPKHKNTPHEPEQAPASEPIIDQKPKTSKTWMIVAVIAIVVAVLLTSLSIYGYMKIKNLDKQVKDQQAQISDLQNKKKTLEDAAAAAASAATSAAANAVASAAANSNFIEIKELGFKLPLTTDIKELQYFVNDKTVFFSTKSLMSSAWAADKGDPGKYCSPGVLPLGAITRFANAADAGPTEQKSLNGFVLGYAPPQADCSNNAATVEMQNKQKAALVAAFKNAQKL